VIRIYILFPVIFLLFFGCTRPVSTPPPAAEIVGEWAGDWEAGEFIYGSATGKIDNEWYLFLVTSRGSELPCESTLRILDIHDPARIVEVASLDIPVKPMIPVSGLATSGEVLYITVGAEGGGLWVVDISDPTSPREITLLETEYPATGLALSGNYAYINTFMKDIFLIVDISDPTQPDVIGMSELSGLHLKTYDSRMCVFGLDGVHILDISFPSSPQEIGFHAAPNCVVEAPEPGEPAPIDFERFFDVALSGSNAYVASGDSGLLIIDISNPACPQKIAQVETTRTAQRVLVSGDFTYLTNNNFTKGETHWSHLLIIDISEPGNPELVDTVETTGYQGNPVKAGDYICFVDWSTVTVIDVSDFN